MRAPAGKLAGAGPSRHAFLQFLASALDSLDPGNRLACVRESPRYGNDTFSHAPAAGADMPGDVDPAAATLAELQRNAPNGVHARIGAPVRNNQLFSSQVLGPISTRETIQRTAPTQMSRREFSIRGMPLDHATPATPHGDDFADAEKGAQPVAEDVADVPAVGTEDLGGAVPSDGLPAPLQYHKRFYTGLIVDIRRKARYYRTDWTDAFLSENLSIIGIMETLLATGISGIINAVLSGQAMTIQGPTGPELAYIQMLVALCTTLKIEFMPAKFWAGLWTSLMTITYTLLQWCCLINKVTRFTEEIFSAMISLIEIVAAGTNIVRVFIRPDPAICAANQTSGCMSMQGKLYTLLIVILTYSFAVKFRQLRSSDWLNSGLRKQLANYGVSIVIIALTIVSSLITPVLGITDIVYLNVPDVIQPTMVDPVTKARRGWLVKPFGYSNDPSKQFPTWAIFLMILPAIGGCLLGYLDQNLTEVLVNRKDRMFKKLPAYHLSNMVVGCLLYPICALLGLPACHPATVRSLAHVMALTSTEVVPLPDGKGATVRIVGVAEQRVTHLVIHILILVALAAGPVLKYVPQPIIIGIFLYLGISSIQGNQMFDRAFVLLGK
ncbi:hypothetical protein KFE25_000659 [Diacronema lutheri]|uniref:Bicarbonate transporter-like transmembrane domain-containing protein n=1 Tax=Diacronema lutheri TaxID=2081491 RepID=A0A8J5XHF4_DIALT|nr:hypothetical protein KFE25_000659 [Diacronema lutheri]